MNDTTHIAAGRPLILNIGLNRAGTTSLTQALRMLGYRAAHFSVGKRRIFDLVRYNAARRRRLLSPLDSRYDAFSDFNAEPFLPLLDRHYPGSRFILTLRELDAWLDSRERKVMQNRADPDYRYAFLDVDRDAWTRYREQYLAAVDAFFEKRRGDLLVIDIPGGDGWEPLCRFLGREVPEQPFPWLHRLEAPGTDDAG
ncbi:MAG: sulfotransferase family protein [Gammaproteobacteria bacterium]